MPITHLEYAIAENKGFVIVTGEIGSGKTTLINFLLTKIPAGYRGGPHLQHLPDAGSSLS